MPAQMATLTGANEDNLNKGNIVSPVPGWMMASRTKVSVYIELQPVLLTSFVCKYCCKIEVIRQKRGLTLFSLP